MMTTKTVLVFGSNLAGRHGKGAALAAVKQWGAVYGQGVGRQGMAYAIPTKAHDLSVLPLNVIKLYVDEFLEYAKMHPELRFSVTRVGCGLAGYSDFQVAPMFKDPPDNCWFEQSWCHILEDLNAS